MFFMIFYRQSSTRFFISLLYYLKIMEKERLLYNFRIKQKVCTTLAALSIELESIKLKDMYLIAFLSILQFLGSCLPLLLTIQNNQIMAIKRSPFAEYIQLRIFSESEEYRIIFSVVHFLVLMLLITLCGVCSKRANRVGLGMGIAYFFIFQQIGFLSAEGFYSADKFELIHILEITNILIGILCCTIYVILRQSYSYKCTNYLLVFPNSTYKITTLSPRILIILAPYLLNHHKIYFLLLYISIFLIELNNFRSTFLYFNSQTARIFRVTLCSKLVVLGLAIILEVFQNKELFQNFIYVVLSTTFFSAWTLERYVSYVQMDIMMLDANSLSSQQQALYYTYLYMKIYHKLEKESYQFSKLIITRYKANHLQQQGLLLQIESMGPEDIEKYVFKQKLNQIGTKYPKDIYLTLFINHQKLQNFDIYTTYLHSLKKVMMKARQNWFCCFSSEKYKTYLKNFIQAKQIQYQFIQTYKVLEADQLIYQLECLVRNSAKNKSIFWEKIYRGIRDTQQIKASIEHQLNDIQELKKIEQKVLTQFSGSPKCLDLIIFFHHFIELKTQISKNLKQLAKQQKLKLHKNLMKLEKAKNNRNYIASQMFASDSCVFESAIDPKNMGIIINSSKSVKDVFGFDKNILKSLQIHTLMPKSMQDEHDNILKNWVETGCQKNLGSLRYIIALKSKQLCFKCAIYLTVVQKLEGLSLFAAFFILNKKDYMLINSDGVIDGAGSNFLDLLGQKIIGLPLSQICKNENSISSSIISRSKKQIRKSRFYSVLNAQERMQKYFTITKQEENNCYFSNEKSYEIQYEIRDYLMGKLKYRLLKFIKIEGRLEVQRVSKIKLDHAVKEDDEITIFLHHESSLHSETTTDLTIEQKMLDLESLYFHPQAINDQALTRYLFVFCLIYLAIFVVFVLLLVANEQFLTFEAQYLNFLHSYRDILQQNFLLYENIMDALISDSIEKSKESLQAQRQEVYHSHSEFIHKNNELIYSLHQLFTLVSNSFTWKFDNDQSIPLTSELYFQYFLRQANQIIESNNPRAVLIYYDNIALFSITIKQTIHMCQQFKNSYNSQIQYKISIFVGLMVGLFLVRCVVVQKLQYLRKKQGRELLMLFGIIEKSNVDLLSQYYRYVGASFLKNPSNQNAELTFSEVMDQLCFVNGREQINRFHFEQSFNYRSLMPFIVRICTLIIIFLYFVTFYSFLSDFKTINLKVIALMEGETQLMSQVGLLKGYSYLSSLELDQEIQNYALAGLFDTKKHMSSLIMDVQHELRRVVPSFPGFLEILSSNICETLQVYNYRFDAQKCQTSLHYQILKHGPITALTILENNYNILLYHTLLTSSNIQEQASDVIMSQISTFLLDFFDILELQIIETMQIHTKGAMTLELIAYECVQIVALLISLGSIYRHYRQDKRKNGENIGKIIVSPSSLIRATKNMSYQINKILRF